ncbi:host specificity factor TipJ family phage tail protein [Methylobacterium platani]|uniref:host specificity factor TipJ family phage tail protein n=1 Tax=Methylobacterium platani TaxID=427683 RepID=UPI001FDA6A75|nr:host specificity factor TipJ family phage tail protein [Methylobacterium platani]
MGGFVAGAVGLTAGTAAFAITSSLVGALVVGAGSLLLSHFLQPKAGGKTGSTDALYSFGLQGNAARPMQPIPVLNGRVRFAPDFAAPVYSEYAGDQMVDYGLYACTCGDMDVEQVELGDTPIWTKAEGYNPSYPGIEIQFVPPGEQVTLYPVNVQTADELQGAELTTEYTPGVIVNAAGTVATELMVDFIWGGGAYVTYKDRQLPVPTDIEVQARTVNAAGAATGAWVQVFRNIYSQNKQSQIRVTERIPVPGGRYEVRARRQNPPIAETQNAKLGGTDAVTWTALRAKINGPQSFPRVYTIAVKGVGNKQNSGVSGGQLRVTGTRKLPVWEDGQWVVKPTRSIAWAALDWWRNSDYSAGLDLANVDFAAFLAYDRLWAQLGHTFDFRFTEVQTLDEVLETVLKAGRAFPAPIGDKLTLTREEPRGLARMLFTDNDIVAGSLEIDYALADQAWADGIIGEYLDETSWRVAEVSSAPDGVVLTNPARVQLQGFVQRVQATGAVRYMAAESQYRRTTVSWTARMEGRLLKRGDLVRISTSEPETWGSSHEIVGSANGGANLRLDPPPIWTEAASHWLEIRQRDGRPFGPVRVTRGASDADLVVNAGDASNAASAAAGQYGFQVSLADAVARDDSEEAPWAAFSPGQPRAYPVLITEGDPDEDGEHIHLKGTLDAPEVYDTTETGVTPLPQVPDLFSSALPVILGLTASISQRQATLVLSAGWLPARNAATYEWALSYDGGVTWAAGPATDRTTIEVIVGASDDMLFRVRGVTPGLQPGGWTITPVIAPPLLINGDLFDDLSINIGKLSAQLQKELGAIYDLGRGTLALGQQLTVDKLAEARGLIDSAREATRLALTTGDDTFLGSIRQLAAAVDRLAAEAATETTRSYEQSQLLKIADGRSFAAIERETRLRVSGDEVLASITTTLAVRLDVAEGGIVGNATAIQGLSTRVTNAEGTITAQSQSITQLSSRIDANDLALSGQATAVQSLTTRVTLTEGNISSLSESLTALRSTVTTQGGQISANATAIDSVRTLAESTDGRVTSEAARTTALEATVADQGRQISGTSTALSALTVRTSTTEGRIDSEASRLDALSSTVSAQGGQIAGTADAVSQLTTRTSAAEGRIESEARRTDALAAEVSTQGGQIGGQARAIDDLGARTTATEAGVTSVANRATALEATVTTQGGQIAGQATATQQLSGRVDDLDGRTTANASSITYLNSYLAGVDQRVAGQAEAAQSLTTQVQNIDGRVSSQAKSITSLSTTQDGHTAQITTLAASYDGVRVQYGVTGYVDGQAGGFVLTGAKSLDGSATFKLLVSADLFVDGLITSRMLSTTSLITTSAQIGNLTVDNINVKDGAISGLVSAQSNGQQTSVTINVRTARAVAVLASRIGDLSSRFSQIGTSTGAIRIYRDGNLIGAIPADFMMDFDPSPNVNRSYLRLGPTTYPILDYPGVGSHTYQVVDDNNVNIGGVYISVQESK